MTEGLVDPPRGLLGDVLVEGARPGARGEDAVDGGVVARAERGGVAQGLVDLLGAIALAQQQDVSRLDAPDTWRALAHQVKELDGVLAHVCERDVELVDVEGALSLVVGVQAGGVEPEPGAARSDLVARDAAQVGGVHEQLALGDADRQDVGDVVVWDGVLIAGPGDEAVDAAHAVHHTRGVVGMPWQRDEVGALLGEALQGGALLERAVVDDAVEPVDELGAHVVEVAERAAIEERALDLPERALGARLVVGVTAPDRDGTELVVAREREELRIVDGLIALPSQHDRLLAVVLALLGAALEALERQDVAVHQRVQVIGLVEAEELALARHQHVRQRLDDDGLASGELHREGDQSLSAISPGPNTGVGRLGAGFGGGRIRRMRRLTAV